jgi:hypothetical protein
LLEANTRFTIISNKPLKIQADFILKKEGGDYSNIMNFSTGVLHLIIIDIVLYGVVFVWLNELVKGVVVVPMERANVI